MEESLEDQVKDFTLGGIDGLTVPVSVAAGLVASGTTKEIIVIAIVAEMIAGATSMGLSEYLSMDSDKERKDIAWKSGLRVSFAYIIGASLSLLIYKFTENPIDALKYSIITNIIALGIFGYYRATFLKLNIQESIKKSLIVGVLAMFITYNVSNAIKNI